MAEREQRIETFEEFWDYYVGEHRKPATRALHFVGTTVATACALGGLLTKRRWLLAVAPVAGYGPAWASHFLIEKNRPATFTYPVWSLAADYVMWWKIATRTMQAEVDRVLAAEAEKVKQREEPSVEREEAQRPPVADTVSEAVN